MWVTVKWSKKMFTTCGVILYLQYFADTDSIVPQRDINDFQEYL